MSQKLFNRVTWLQTLTVVVMLTPLAGAGLYVWVHHQSLESHLADLEPRYARLAGLLERQEELKAKVVHATEQLNRITYPATQDKTQAGNEAQQRIRGIFAESKLDIISIQVLPPAKEETQFDRIPINLRVEGDLAGIQNALLKLAQQSPLVLVDSMSIQTIGAVRPASIQRLGGQFSLSVLRVRA